LIFNWRHLKRSQEVSKYQEKHPKWGAFCLIDGGIG